MFCHLKQVHMGYWEHWRQSNYFACMFIKQATKAIVHAWIPDLCIDATSTFATKTLPAEIEARRQNIAGHGRTK